MDLKCDHRDPYKRETEGDLTQTNTEEKGTMRPWRQRLEGCDHKPRDTGSFQEWGEDVAMGNCNPLPLFF